MSVFVATHLPFPPLCPATWGGSVVSPSLFNGRGDVPCTELSPLQVAGPRRRTFREPCWVPDQTQPAVTRDAHRALGSFGHGTLALMAKQAYFTEKESVQILCNLPLCRVGWSGSYNRIIFSEKTVITIIKQSYCLNRRRQCQPTPVLLPGESQGRRGLVGCRLWGRTESDTTEAT